MDHGDEREVESGLIFNQLICEFESRHPCQVFAPVAQLEERDASNVAVAGSSPARSSSFISHGLTRLGRIAEAD